MSQREIAEILWKSDIPELQGISPDQFTLIFEEADKIVSKALYRYRKDVQDGLSKGDTSLLEDFGRSAIALPQVDGQKDALQSPETGVRVNAGPGAGATQTASRGVKVPSDGKPYDESLSVEELAKAPQAVDPITGQHGAHWVLSDEDLASGYIRPVRLSYLHRKCGKVTSMPIRIAQTYAKQPDFYSRTFCCECREYQPVSQFEWLDDKTTLGS